MVNLFFQGHRPIFQHLNIPVLPQHTSEPLFNLQYRMALKARDYISDFQNLFAI